MKIAKIILSCLILISIQSGAEQAESRQEPATKTLLWPDGTRYVGEVIDGKRAGRGSEGRPRRQEEQEDRGR